MPNLTTPSFFWMEKHALTLKWGFYCRVELIWKPEKPTLWTNNNAALWFMWQKNRWATKDARLVQWGWVSQFVIKAGRGSLKHGHWFFIAFRGQLLCHFKTHNLKQRKELHCRFSHTTIVWGPPTSQAIVTFSKKTLHNYITFYCCSLNGLCSAGSPWQKSTHFVHCPEVHFKRIHRQVHPELV